MDRRVGRRIQYLSNQSKAYVNALLKEEGLTHGECNLLISIYKNEGLSQDAVSKELMIDKSAITRIIKSTIEKGYVKREVNLQDRRYSCLYLTNKATDKIEDIFNVFKKSSHWMLEGLTDSEIDSVIYLLDKMCDNIRKKVKQYE